MNKISLKSIVWKEDGYYVSQCLEVDVSSFGKTKKQALENLKDALALYFDDVPPQSRNQVKNPAIATVSLQHA
jgi:predicted RNase H-like HicB family nuclease